MFIIVSCHYILGCDLLHSDKQLIQIWIFVDCFSDMTNTSLFLSAVWERNIHPGSWRSVGSAMFILLICACVIGIVFDLRIFCQTLWSHLPVSWAWHPNSNVLQRTERKWKSEDPLSTVPRFGAPPLPSPSLSLSYVNSMLWHRSQWEHPSQPQY